MLPKLHDHPTQSCPICGESHDGYCKRIRSVTFDGPGLIRTVELQQTSAFWTHVTDGAGTMVGWVIAIVAGIWIAQWLFP